MGKFDQRAEEFGLLVGLHDSARRVEDMPLDWITPDPGNPRRTFDEAELNDLAASIAARGVLQPILVAPKNGDGLHVIRVGERRFRASRLAGRETIPAIVMAVVNRADTLADQIVENDQRAGLTPHDLATGIERMLGAGVTQAEIARALGRSKQFVSLYAACADMAPWLRAAIDRMPIRLLYDLHRAARTYGDAVRAYVEGLGDENVTLAEGSRFIASLKASASVADAQQPQLRPVEDRDGAARGGSMPPVRANRGLKAMFGPDALPPSQRLGDVRVTCAGRAGRLLLPEQVRVLFDDGEEIDAPIGDIILG
ncbi:KorB domain-containing protein (plasmid) [Sphingomonas naphthae]|jgi:ParB family chromosome partitioning protein|uniref:KorB domain-containing protein n=1 Tax=Sphingomonas naphthae TaxID=1813468 RepID=A0ABY7TRK3_9SPHN|nr:ParB/RepB/Spo0J family partition protein [Sphingomonas naphthae]WCT75823.1 KorB domain-containing protein [Sphingomonas naphthae]